MFCLLCRQLEHEICGKTIDIPAYSFVKIFGFNPIECRQIPVEEHFVPTNQQDRLFNSLQRNTVFFLCRRSNLLVARQVLLVAFHATTFGLMKEHGRLGFVPCSLRFQIGTLKKFSRRLDGREIF